MNSAWHAIRQRGFSMIEVLIAVLILSIGITSIGMMMLATLNNARGAMFQSRAVALAQDMAERIRANGDGRQYYDTGMTTGADKSCFQTGDSAPSSCSAQDLAAHDIWQWQTSLAAPITGLPAATGSIERDTSTSPPEFRITVNWSEGNGTSLNFLLRTRL